jgi:Na+-driven multidrug efflux pump
MYNPQVLSCLQILSQIAPSNMTAEVLEETSFAHATSEFQQLLSLAALAVPALGIVVVDPLMGLVDTACIGHTSTHQLAALAPNSAVFNMMFQV